MSCNGKIKAVGRTAAKNGITPTSNESAGGGQVSFFSLASPRKATQANGKPASEGQVSFFSPPPGPGQTPQALSKRREIRLVDFSAADLQQLLLETRLDEAATRRHLREIGSGAPRGIGHSDPRPADWARLDQKYYGFMAQQLAEVRRRGRGTIDTSALKLDDLVELWEFARYEAGRAARQIDHLAMPGSSIGGPTADYLTERHKLKTRFYSYLAGQLETIIPRNKLEAATAWEAEN